MSFAGLAFVNPWLLAGLLSLPLLYWLLRTVPPRPRQVEFPATRILVGIENEDKTPAKTPWWLLVIRLLAAALVVCALAEPVLNPAQRDALAGTGPVVIVLDNGWAAAPAWGRRKAMGERLISGAQSQSRAVMVVETAPASKTRKVRLEAPSDARATLQGLEPRPFAPDRLEAARALGEALKGQAGGVPSIFWLTDGVDHGGNAFAFADALKALGQAGTVAAIEPSADDTPLGLSAGVGSNGKILARVIRTGGPEQKGSVSALSARGQKLGDAPFSLAAGATSVDVPFEFPLELRNQVARLELAEGRSAGGVALLDGRSQWQRVGIISGESQEQSQALLAPLYYIEKAIAPFSEVVKPKDQNLAESIDAVLKQNASVLMLADIGTLSGEVKSRVEAWVKKGGVLVRFAGPRLESGGDDLLPVALRSGGRQLGGALSWSTPQALGKFDDAGLFAGLVASSDITVNRQVLADPAQLTPDVKVWARLYDGTPLVTAVSRGAGQIVLFHITANSDWSNLPISGLFVEMLRRITGLGTLTVLPEKAADAPASLGGSTQADQASQDGASLAPVQTLDGFGTLGAAPPMAEGILIDKLAQTVVGIAHPPGYYGAQGRPRALNVIGAGATLAAMPALPSGIARMAYAAQLSTPMMPWLLSAALLLIFADMIAVLVLLGGGALLAQAIRGRARAASHIGALMLGTSLLLAASAMPSPSFAQQGTPLAGPASGKDQTAERATDRVTLGYVLTGDAETDRASEAGLSGLSRVLASRTAVDPGAPMAVDIVKDEIAFFPVLYWPVLENATTLPQAALAKIDAFMKQGGMIVFDTRDYGTGLTGTRLSGKNGSALQRLIGAMDVPRLEPVPSDHVLTRSFYLLQSFPGRWDGGELWVEARSEDARSGRQARRADGVTSIMITSNDLASAWALDRSGRPLYPVVPGGERQREMALRTGINIVMHALTGNYKADQVHVPALLERLGQ